MERLPAVFFAHGSPMSALGGDDHAAALARFGLADRVDHLSSGGGATLELIEGRTLPGVQALEGVVDRGSR